MPREMPTDCSMCSCKILPQFILSNFFEGPLQILSQGKISNYSLTLACSFCIWVQCPLQQRWYVLCETFWSWSNDFCSWYLISKPFIDLFDLESSSNIGQGHWPSNSSEALPINMYQLYQFEVHLMICTAGISLLTIKCIHEQTYYAQTHSLLLKSRDEVLVGNNELVSV